MHGLPVILKRHNLQSLDKASGLLIEFKFCESDFYFLNGSKNCVVATYNLGSVYTNIQCKKEKLTKFLSHQISCVPTVYQA